MTSIDQNHERFGIRTQSVRKPKNSVTGEEQCALARVMMALPDAPHLIITLANTTVCFGIQVCFTIRSSTTGPWSAPVPLVITTSLDRGVLGVRPETLESRGDEALG